MSRRPLAALGAAGTVVWIVAAIRDTHGDTGGIYLLAIAAATIVLLVAALVVRRIPVRAAVPVILVAAVAFRLAQVWVPPELSDDLYRYLWDGEVQTQGVNPYRYAPEDPALASLRDDDVYPEINRKPVHTIYPPVAQVSFASLRLVGVARPVTLKLVWTGVDVLVMLLLLRVLRAGGRDERLLLLYAWNPLIVLSVAHEGHVDVLAVLAVVGAIRAWQRDRSVVTGALLGVAAGIKLFPLLLLPAFVRAAAADDPDARPRRWRWSVPVTAAGVLAASYLPYLSVGRGVLGFLTADGYLREEGYVSGRRFVLASALGVDGVVLALVVGAVVALWAVRSRRPAAARAAALFGAALLLTTPYPWYATLLVACAVAGGPGFVRGGGLVGAELVWPLFGVALEVIYVSIAHGFGLSTTVERQLTITAVLVAIGTSVVAEVRRSRHPEASPPAERREAPVSAGVA